MFTSSLPAARALQLRPSRRWPAACRLVACDAPGVRDILEGAEASGGVVAAREDRGALGRALEAMLTRADFRRELGRRARRRVEEAFSPEIVGRQLRDFLIARGASTSGRP
jgi:starch synthase